ncbi:MAG: hypothetical protein HY884_09820 [Deltaproteobacteria bacterium]|nr:hypothetical protein [Deltaproteobacteria bacterium]
MRTSAIIAVALAALSIYGCGLQKTVAPASKPLPLRSLRSAAVITLKNNGAEISGRASVIVKSPDFLRIEVYGPLGGIAALFIYDGVSLYIHSDDGAALYNGHNVDTALPLPAQILVLALTGDTLRLKDLAGVDLNTSGMDVTKHEFGLQTGSVRLFDFRDVDGFFVPFSIVIREIKTGRVITIEHSRVEINPDVPPSAFEPPNLIP